MTNRQLDEEAIFQLARKLDDPNDRSTYLEQVCAGDAPLRERVIALLDIHERDQEFLKSNGDPAPTTEPPVIREAPGQEIGRYKLLQRIGEGGFGIVYMAEQERPVHRKVALKVIKPGMDTRAVVARFEAERQALALMDHPNIARVFDGGATDSGRPFFVLELVKGIPITQYCDEHRLTPRQRLELFVPVCQAIQHAHQKGVIHRDLKPSNVLVAEYDDRPVPKIIDFGVAKAIGHRLTEKTMFTEYGQIVGTLEYMSPEQAKLNQLDIDTRSDVYSLGVLLYELLAGETPFDRQRLRTAAYDELLRIVREEEPPRPSVRLSSNRSLLAIAERRHMEPEKLSTLLRGELDWIVMKALEKDRGRRYASASSFADDVQRFLLGESVEAHPPSVAYRLRTFIRRNKLAATVSAIVLTALALGLLLTNLGIWKLNRLNESLETTIGQVKEEAARADREKNAAIDARNELKKQSYARTMVAAFQAWETADPVRAQALLGEARSFESQGEAPDLAWRFLNTRCREGLPSEVTFAKTTNCIAYSPDGKAIAVAISNRGVVLRDVESGKESPLELPRGDTAYESVQCLEFTPDGKWLVAGGALQDSTGFVCAWDMSTRLPTLLPVKHSRCVLDISLSADGNLGVSASVDRVEPDRTPTSCTCKLWRMPSGEEIRQWPTPIDTYAVRVLFVPPENRVVAVTGRNGLQFWNVESAEELPPMEIRPVPSDFCFSSDGQSLVTVADDGVRWWDLNTKVPQKREKLTWRRCDAVAFSPDGTLVAARDRDSSKILVWFRTSRQEMTALSGGYETPSDFGIPSLVFSPDSNQIAIGRGKLKVWDLEHWKASRFDGFAEITALIPAVANKVLVVADAAPDRFRTFRVDLSNGSRSESLGAILGLSPRRTRIATQTDDGLVHVWDVQTNQQLAVLDQNCCPPISFSGDDGKITTAGRDSTINQVNLATGERTVLGAYRGKLRDRSHFALGGYPERPRALALSPVADRLVTAATVEPKKVEVVIWDLNSGSRTVLGSYDFEYVGVSFSPKGKYLAVTPMYPETRSGLIRIWDMAGTKADPLREFPGPERIHCFRFSCDERMCVLSGRAPGTLMLYDLVNGKSIPLSGSTGGWVCSADFSPDGRTLITASPYGQVKFWSTSTGEELGKLDLDEKVGQIQVTGEDGTLVTASWDGVVKFWPVKAD